MLVYILNSNLDSHEELIIKQLFFKVFRNSFELVKPCPASQTIMTLWYQRY